MHQIDWGGKFHFLSCTVLTDGDVSRRCQLGISLLTTTLLAFLVTLVMICTLSEIVIASRSMFAMYCAFNSVVSTDSKVKQVKTIATNIVHVGNGLVLNRGAYRKNKVS